MGIHRIRPLKKYGQSFLIDRKIIQKIMTCAKLGREDTVLEIGAGHGELTHPTAGSVKKLIAIEIDKRLCTILRAKLTDFRNVDIIQGDFLKIDIRRLIGEMRISGGVKVIGNLPYYITTPILMKLFREKDLFNRFIIMDQREVADRMAAHPGTRDYGALSLAVSYHSKIEKVIPVEKEAFRPQPRVDSALISLVLRKKPAVRVRDEALFFSFTRAIFGGRRKMLSNALLRAAPLGRQKTKELLLNADIDPRSRAENVSLKQFARLFNSVYQEANHETYSNS